jgi:hypothetical protein
VPALCFSCGGFVCSGAQVLGRHECAHVVPAVLLCFGRTVRYRLSEYARQEIERRRIPLSLVEAVMERPDQVVPSKGTARAYQSKCEIGGKMFLLRVIVDESVDPAVVVTAYRTTKIQKYWGKP